MKALLFPLALGLVGLGAGVGAGMFLSPEPEPEEITEDSAEPEKSAEKTSEDTADADSEFARMSNQFIVPVVHDSAVAALVVLSITLEVDIGSTTTVYQKEPRLRDRFLRVLFDHANIGGFDIGFTQSGTLEILRKALHEVAQDNLGEILRDVLIVEIVRQEV